MASKYLFTMNLPKFVPFLDHLKGYYLRYGGVWGLVGGGWGWLGMVGGGWGWIDKLPTPFANRKMV